MSIRQGFRDDKAFDNFVCAMSVAATNAEQEAMLVGDDDRAQFYHGVQCAFVAYMVTGHQSERPNDTQIGLGYNKAWTGLRLVAQGVQTGIGVPPNPLPTFLEEERVTAEQQAAGQVLVADLGYLEGWLEPEPSMVCVEARESALVVVGPGASRRFFPYQSVPWFSIEPEQGEPFPEELFVVPGEDLIHITLSEGDLIDRWGLVVTSEDAERWRGVLEQFRIEDRTATGNVRPADAA
jgi:hypothetical protein